MNADPLADLRGLHLPPEPGLWPLAPGWWLLLAALLVLGLAVVWLWRHRAQKRQPHPALAEAARLQVRAQSLDDHALITQCAALLRRVAIQQHGPHVAGLAGTAWAQFLESHAPSGSRDGGWSVFGEARYAPAPTVSSREQLVAACRAWVVHAVDPEQHHAHV